MVIRTGLLVGPNDCVNMQINKEDCCTSGQAHCCLVAKSPMCSAAQEFALGWWRQTHEAAILCADVLHEIHRRDLKVLQ